MKKKIHEFRLFFKKRGIDAVILTGTDPWGSEYVSDKWQTRKYLTGFTGSAGTVVVTGNQAGLWTDFRYYIQAERELSGSGVLLFRQSEPGVPDWDRWLVENLPRGSVVAVDPRTLSVHQERRLRDILEQAGIQLVTQGMDLLTDCITDESPESDIVNDIWFLDEQISGESMVTRLEKLRQWLENTGAEAVFVSPLDEQCWLLNFRGGDIPFNTLAEGYLMVTRTGGAYWSRRCPADISLTEYLKPLGIGCYPLSELAPVASRILLGMTDPVLLYDPDRCGAHISPALAQVAKLREVRLPVAEWKAVKNRRETELFQEVLEHDVLTLARLEQYLRDNLSRGQSVTEDQAADYLLDLRREVGGFLCSSFGTISASGENGALCHYTALPGKGRALSLREPFLIDSGCHYLRGTTDLTRTFFWDKDPPVKLAEDYTLVLKAHITLAQARFPAGTRGYQLDALARKPLWSRGITYGHGTGHGVGFLLPVHEGPQSLSPRPLDQPILPGMVLSCEPGIYREGEWGIRLENLMVCEPWLETEFGNFYGFRILSFYPFEEDLILSENLDRKERNWLLCYYQEMETLFMGGEHRNWFQAKYNNLKKRLSQG